MLRLDGSFAAGVRSMAEREGFEPSIRFCRILTFQASAFDHSATAPHALEASPPILWFRAVQCFASC
jgi:hypothetical protein